MTTPENINTVWTTWALRPTTILIRRALKKNFCGAWISSKQLIAESKASGRPLICCASHTNWWDGFVAAVIHRECTPARHFTLMQEQQHLAKYPFFKLSGVFGVDLDGSAIKGVRHALHRLRNPSCELWMFPQGKFCHADDPVQILPGASLLARRSNAFLIPLWFHYQWLFESKPALFIDVGEPLAPESADNLEQSLESLRRNNSQRRNPNSYAPLIKPTLSLNKVWELWAQRLGLLKQTKKFEPWNR